MKDVSDYLIRMAVAIFLCPVAVAFWLAIAAAGFSPGGLMQMMGGLAQRYAAMGAEVQQTFLLEVLFGWAALAFVAMLISFVVKRPHFGYILKKKDGKPSVAVTQ
jgi:hypothetical protein